MVNKNVGTCYIYIPQWGICGIKKLAYVGAQFPPVGLGFSMNLVDDLRAQEVLNNDTTVTFDDIHDVFNGSRGVQLDDLGVLSLVWWVGHLVR